MKKGSYQALKAEWDAKLKDSGFEDIEDSKERLKTPDRRLISFGNRETLLNYYLALDSYLNTKTDLPDRDRRILELHSAGIHLKQIALKTEVPYRTVKWLIAKYRNIILNS